LKRSFNTITASVIVSMGVVYPKHFINPMAKVWL